MRKVAAVVGVIGVLLGGLWLLQGTGVLHLKPILCFADCASVQGPSLGWALAGLFLLAAGAAAIRYSVGGPPRG